jgi:hypothetical protein
MNALKLLTDIIQRPYRAAVEYRDNKDCRPALYIAAVTSLSFMAVGAISAAKGGQGSILDVIYVSLLTFATYFAACFGFKLTAAATGRRVEYSQILATWGFSYIPTFCFLLYLLISHLFFLGVSPSPNSLATIITMAVMITLFIWKVIFYLIELIAVLGEKLWGIVVASLILGALFIAYYLFSAYVLGLKVPIV